MVAALAAIAAFLEAETQQPPARPTHRWAEAGRLESQGIAPGSAARLPGWGRRHVR
jgi:hypothetical protein